MKKILIIPFLLITLSVFSQYKPGKSGGLYRTGDEKLDKGWYLGIGATYMMPYSQISETIEFTDSLGNTFTQKYTAQPKTTFGESFTTQFGLFAEIGRFKMTGKRLINYSDYGLAYKWFRGLEDFSQTTYSNGVETSSSETRGTYSDHAISGHFNLGYRYDMSDKSFMVNGLGLNADYFIITSRDGGGTILGQPQEFVADFVGELHYFFGLGFKTGRLIIMPMIETPILAIYPFNHIKSTHDYFNSRSRPFLIRVRFMLLNKKSTSCPKVFDPMGIDPNGNRPK